MPKLAALKGGIANLEKRLSTVKQTDDVSRGTLIKEINNALNAGVGDRVEGLLTRLFSEADKRNQKDRKELLKSIVDILTILNDNHHVLAETLSEGATASKAGRGSLSASITDAQKSLDSSVKETAQANATFFTEVKSLISNLPTFFPVPKETDLSVMESMMVEALDKLNVEPKPQEWVFDFERDVNSRIKTVTARAV